MCLQSLWIEIRPSSVYAIYYIWTFSMDIFEILDVGFNGL